MMGEIYKVQIAETEDLSTQILEEFDKIDVNKSRQLNPKQLE